MTRSPSLSPAQRMAAWRRTKAERNECQRCDLPVYFDPRTGRLRRMCLRHLDLDVARKKGERRG